MPLNRGCNRVDTPVINEITSPITAEMKYPYEFNDEIRQKARSVSGLIFRLSVTSAVAAFSLLLILIFGGPGTLISLSFEPLPWIFRTAIFTTALIIIFYAAGLPFAYEIHRIKKKNEIATSCNLRWFFDSLKALLVSIATTAGASIILFAFITASNLWWIFAATAYVLFTITYSRFFPLLALRLFYHIRPLDEGRPKEEIMSLLRLLGLGELNIYVMNESSRSRMANAFVTGIGRKKRVVLFDNIIRFFTPEETKSITAHELGHYVAGDSIKSTIVNTVIAYVSAFLIYLVYTAALKGHWVYSRTDPFLLLLFSLTFMLVGTALSPIINYNSRRRERQADLFSLNACGDPTAFISGEKRLCDINLMHDNPPWFRRMLFATHPSTAERIRMGEEWNRPGKLFKEG